MEEFLKKLKNKLDIDLLGVVKCENFENIEKDIEQKFSSGHNCSFEKNDIEKMTNPKSLLENAKTVFVIGMSYYWDTKRNGKYKISNHACGIDYHIVLKEKLLNLRNELSKYFEFRSLLQVDSGSLFEKEFGRRAGFGFIGKNSLLINDVFGSYFFIGLLITDLEWEDYSKPCVSSCGDCDICKKFCPAGAILGNYKVDSSICHSFLTQSKTTIPETENIRFAYGCDICQEVCPKNKNISKNLHTEFEPKISSFDDLKIDTLSNRMFKKRFSEFSFSWINKNVILRNIEILDKRDSNF